MKSLVIAILSFSLFFTPGCSFLRSDAGTVITDIAVNIAVEQSIYQLLKTKPGADFDKAHLAIEMVSKELMSVPGGAPNWDGAIVEVTKHIPTEYQSTAMSVLIGMRTAVESIENKDDKDRVAAVIVNAVAAAHRGVSLARAEHDAR